MFQTSLRHVHIFQLRVTFHRRHAKVAADAAGFEATEGRLDVYAAVAVHAQHPALDGAAYPERASEVVGPEGTAQAVGRGVHLAEHLGLVVEWCDADDRTEDFLPPTTVLPADIEQHGRFEVVTLRIRTSAAASGFPSALSGLGEEFLDCRPLAGGNERAKLGLRLGWVADDEFPGCGDELPNEQLVDAAFDEHAAASAAVLPGVGEDAHG